jgi:hypothetical protein
MFFAGCHDVRLDRVNVVNSSIRIN